MSHMKYICFEHESGRLELVTFPKNIDHDVMAESMGRMKDQTHGQWAREIRRPVSAGFVSCGKCYGESMTLGLDAREADTALLNAQLGERNYT